MEIVRFHIRHGGDPSIQPFWREVQKTAHELQPHRYTIELKTAKAQEISNQEREVAREKENNFLQAIQVLKEKCEAFQIEFPADLVVPLLQIDNLCSLLS